MASQARHHRDAEVNQKLHQERHFIHPLHLNLQTTIAGQYKNTPEKLSMAIPAPHLNERPTSYADRVGSRYVSTVTNEHRRKNGLYLTPVAIADFMSNLHDVRKVATRLLDPAAGAGILLCSLVELIVGKNRDRIQNINLTAYEIDADLIPYLITTMKYLENWCSERGVTLDVHIECADFVLARAASLEGKNLPSNGVTDSGYDIVISNPPYFKINKNDPRALAVSSVIHGQPNIYGLFMAVGAATLSQGGEFIYITPRSFTSGQYFRALRERLFTLIKPETVHVFESRLDAFNRDDVLQENIILKGTRQPEVCDGCTNVIISSSHGAVDIDTPRHQVLPLADLLDKSKGMVLRLPINEEAGHLLKTIDQWTGTLEKYGLKISTGQVVPFRATDLLDMSGEVPRTHTPLLWMNHINAMHTHWPKNIKKPQYIKNEAAQRKLLVENKNYVLLRRFSAKEEKRRLNAVPHLAQAFDTPMIAFENHLNYIYRPIGQLHAEEAVGLAALLNSEIMNRYYSIINGNTQVSATELRVLPLPPHKLIIAIGKTMLGYNSHVEAMLDDVVTQTLDFPKDEKQKRQEQEYA